MESANREEDEVAEASEENISEVNPALSPIESPIDGFSNQS